MSPKCMSPVSNQQKEKKQVQELNKEFLQFSFSKLNQRHTTQMVYYQNQKQQIDGQDRGNTLSPLSHNLSEKDMEGFSGRSGRVSQLMTPNSKLQGMSGSQRETQQLSQNQKNEVTVYEFIWAFMQVLEHDREEELFITNALIEFYEHIKEQVKEKPVQWQDATNILIELMHEQEFTGSAGGGNTGGLGKLSVKAEKKIRHPRNNIQEKMIRKLGLELPDLVGEDENKLSFFVKSNNADKKTHKSGINQTQLFKATNQILCLDFNSSALYAYDAEIQGTQKFIVPQDHPNDPTILDFAVDNKTERIGACLRDYSLCFWESEDNFKFEKVIKTHTLQHLQVKIWCLESCSKWITTDKKNSLHLWDLEFEEPKTLQRIHKMKIMDVIDVFRINAMLSSSLDKNIIVWDLKDFEMRFVIDLKNSFSIHTLKYSYQHDLLFTASYETQIKIWHFDSAIECTNVSTLTGHESMVTAIDLIQDTNYLVSSDDFGCIKCWNLKNQQCIQTFRFNFEILVSKLIGVTPESFISVSNRIYLFNLTQLDVENLAKTKATISTTQEVKKPKNIPKPSEMIMQSIQENEIIDIFYSGKNDQIVCVTKQDVRIIDCLTGKQVRIMVNLTRKDEDITHFCLDETEKRFYVSDHMGSIQIFGYNSGKLVKQLQHHRKEVSCIDLDSKNNLLLSCGFDNVIMIQTTTREEPVVLRTLIHPLGSEDILFCKSSFHLNMIATANDKTVLIWNYENMRLMGVCYIDDLDIRQIYFLDPYPILAALDFNGSTYFFHLNYSESLQFYKALSRLDMDGSTDEYYFKDYPRCLTKSIYCHQLEDKESLSLENECLIALGTKNGYIFVYEFSEYFENELNLQPVTDRRDDPGANPMRNDEFDGSKYFPLGQQNILQTDIFKDIDPQLNITKIEGQQYLQLKKKMHGKDSINLIKIVRIQENRCVITCSPDGFIKMSSLHKGELICSSNICNPLPALWNLHYTKNRKRFMKIKRAIQTLRVMNHIFRSEPLNPDPDLDKIHDTTMFLTQAFELDYLMTKYGNQNLHKTMKQATKDYLKILESEVSSKTTLRNLQYRQNRLKEEKKEINMREEVDIRKEKEKKAEIQKKRLQKNQLIHEDKLDRSVGEEDTAIIEDEKMIKLKIQKQLDENRQLQKQKAKQQQQKEDAANANQRKSVKHEDILNLEDQLQPSDRILELEEQEKQMRKKLQESEVMEFTHQKTFDLASALDRAQKQADKYRRQANDDNSSTLSSTAKRRHSQIKFIPGLMKRQIGSTKNWILHAEEKGAVLTDPNNTKKAFKEILKNLHLQVNRTRIQASKNNTLIQNTQINTSNSILSPTIRDVKLKRDFSQSQLNNNSSKIVTPLFQYNSNSSNLQYEQPSQQTIQFSQSQILSLPHIKSRLSLADKIDIEVQQAFDRIDNEVQSSTMSPMTQNQTAQYLNSQNISMKVGGDITGRANNSVQQMSKYFLEKRNVHSKQEVEKLTKKKLGAFSNVSDLNQINSIINQTIHQTSAFEKSYKTKNPHRHTLIHSGSNPNISNTFNSEDIDTLNLLIKHKPTRNLNLMSPQNFQTQMDKDRLFISNKMKKALFDKGKKDLNRLGIGKIAYSNNYSRSGSTKLL